MGSDHARPQNEVKALYEFEAVRGYEAMRWGPAMQGQRAGGMDIYEIRIKSWPDGNEPLLAIVKATGDDGTPYIGFHGGSDVVGMLASAFRRIQNGSFKWRPDEYAGK